LGLLIDAGLCFLGIGVAKTLRVCYECAIAGVRQPFYQRRSSRMRKKDAGREGGVWQGCKNRVPDQFALVCVDKLQKYPMDYSYPRVDILSLELLCDDFADMYLHQGFISG
jgi:hypothetical protein